MSQLLVIGNVIWFPMLDTSRDIDEADIIKVFDFKESSY